MGTDLGDRWWPVTVGCVAAVTAAVAWRLTLAVLAPTRSPDPDPADPAMTMPIRRLS